MFSVIEILWLPMATKRSKAGSGCRCQGRELKSEGTCMLCRLYIPDRDRPFCPFKRVFFFLFFFLFSFRLLFPCFFPFFPFFPLCPFTPFLLSPSSFSASTPSCFPVLYLPHLNPFWPCCHGLGKYSPSSIS